MGPSTGARSKQKGQLDPHHIPPIAGAFTQMVDNMLPPMRTTGSCPSNIIQIKTVQLNKRAQEVTRHRVGKDKNQRISSTVRVERRSQLLLLTDARYPKLLQQIQRVENRAGQYLREVKVEQRREIKLKKG